jgi:hypothetical protein
MTPAQELLEKHREYSPYLSLRTKRWLHALDIAKMLFEDQGYKTDYLNQIVQYIKQHESE